jgi:glutamate-ammonia-ligase adenylyltransferase
MREKMHAAHPNDSGLFDVKHDSGGMIDIEFMVQFLVLAHACGHARLVANLGNIALLGICADLGLVPPSLSGGVQEAYREFRRMQHELRLNGAPFARVAPQLAAKHSAAVLQLWDVVFSSRSPLK